MLLYLCLYSSIFKHCLLIQSLSNLGLGVKGPWYCIHYEILPGPILSRFWHYSWHLGKIMFRLSQRLYANLQRPERVGLLTSTNPSIKASILSKLSRFNVHSKPNAKINKSFSFKESFQFVYTKTAGPLAERETGEKFLVCFVELSVKRVSNVFPDDKMYFCVPGRCLAGQYNTIKRINSSFNSLM